MRRPVLAVVAQRRRAPGAGDPRALAGVGDGALRQFPEGNETRVGAELAGEASGLAPPGPTQVVAELRRGHASDAREPRAPWRASRADIAPRPRGRAGRRAGSRRRTAGPCCSRSRPATTPRAARRERWSTACAQAGARRGPRRAWRDVEVGGATARGRGLPRPGLGLDVEDHRSSCWRFCYLVLILLLRSLLLPLKAVLMNLLSVGAAYGVLVAVFQWGWLDGFLGFESLGYINTMTPPLLAGDRLRPLDGLRGLPALADPRALRRTATPAAPSPRGSPRSAATISCAALIMVAVFAVFVVTGVPSIKEIGLGIAVAIALDATLVRLVLVPATMEIMGKWNWWLPAPLARVLPEASFEASGRADSVPARA